MTHWRMAALALTAFAGTARAASGMNDESDRIDRIMQADPRAEADPVGTLFLGTPATTNGSESTRPEYTLDSNQDRIQRLGSTPQAPQAGPRTNAAGQATRPGSTPRTPRAGSGGLWGQTELTGNAGGTKQGKGSRSGKKSKGSKSKKRKKRSKRPRGSKQATAAGN